MTPKQAGLLSQIVGYLRREQRSPTVRELQCLLKAKSPRSVGQFLDGLEKAGYIKRGKGARNIRILQVPYDAAEGSTAKTVLLPILGAVPCGAPFLAEQNIEDYVSVSVKLARPPHNYFLLRAKGDSMNAAGIKDGDLLLVRQQAVAETGQNVVALIDGEATVKKIKITDKCVTLNPVSHNPERRPIILEKDFQVQGIVLQVIESGP